MTSDLPHVVLDDRRAEPLPVVDGPALSALLAAVLAAEGVGSAAECSLSFVDPPEIAALKAEYLDGDGAPTDVLSFPIDGADDPAEGAADADGVGWMVGDVVVCPLVAEAQAPGHAGTLADEMALLVVHGALHLVGWDHAEESERAAMWARERDLLGSLHGAPAADPWAEAAQ